MSFGSPTDVIAREEVPIVPPLLSSSNDNVPMPFFAEPGTPPTTHILKVLLPFSPRGLFDAPFAILKTPPTSFLAFQTTVTLHNLFLPARLGIRGKIVSLEGWDVSKNKAWLGVQMRFSPNTYRVLLLETPVKYLDGHLTSLFHAWASSRPVHRPKFGMDYFLLRSTISY